VAEVGELRSELVTVVATDRPDDPLLLVGFLAGATTTARSGRGSSAGAWRCRAEAFLGGAVLGAGEERPLHPVVLARGDQAPELLATGRRQRCPRRRRTGAPYQVGWCSWYQWFHTITEHVLRENLALAAEWPFEVFQLDDGYQHAIGDWERTDASFPSGIAAVADAIVAEGAHPGLWLAPFLAAPAPTVAGANPDWVVRHGSGRPTGRDG
jgi:alpha-galactosidase